jgi:serine/threonine-protein phosphatase PP1 catalytic subunit
MEKCRQLYALLQANRAIPRDDHIHFNPLDLTFLCDQALPFLSADPMLLKLTAPITIVGDVHGQFTDLMQFLEKGGDPSTTRYLFLGDYVDRGPHSIETISVLLCLKILFPNNVFLLRGNHETIEISALYGFSEECERLYSTEIWAKFNELFRFLPLAAVVSNRIFCVHGGISKELHFASEIAEVERPLDVPRSGLITDLLWADPADSPDAIGFREGDREVGCTFGRDVAQKFLEDNDFDLICRAHQVVEWGFDFPFGDDQSVVTVFSAPHYCADFGNKGAIMKVAADLTCSFALIDPTLIE